MKKYILSLFVSLFGFLCFCNAGSYTYSGIANESNPLPLLFVPQTSFDTNITLSCVFTPLTTCGGDGPVQFRYQFLYYYGNSSKTNLNTVSDYYVMGCNGDSISLIYDFSTFSSSGPYAGYKGVSLVQFPNFYAIPGFDISYSCTFQGNYVLDSSSSGGGSCPSCPSTGEILSGYVPSSLLNECESDLLFCESNTSGFNSLLNTCSSNLNACNTSLSSCLQNNCPEITGLVNWSELKINDIVHQSAPFINITIPEEFDWNYTVDENEFDLSVSGYNVDTEYIDGIIRLQNTKPSNSDFNKIVSELLPAFVPGLVIILFIYFIFRFVKKIF